MGADYLQRGNETTSNREINTGRVFCIKAVKYYSEIPIFEQRRKKGKKGKMLKDWE